MITKILVYHGRYDDIYIDVSTAEKERQAYLALFRFINQVTGCYIPRYMNVDMRNAFDGALAGDWRAAKWLLQLRRDYDYEKWDIVHCVRQDEIDQWLTMTG